MTLIPFLVGLVTFAAAAFVLRRRQTPDPRRRIRQLVEPRKVAGSRSDGMPERGLLRRPVAASEPWLVRVPGWEQFGVLLERAGIPRPPVETAWLGAAGLVLVTVLAALVSDSLVTVVVVAVLAIAAARLGLGMLAARRRRAFDEHLPDVLAEIASALRAGHGFLQAVQAVAAEAPSPIGPELRRVLAEARLGRPLDDALLAAGERIKSEDFDFVLDAVVVQRQVGGSLAGIFEIVGDSVRQRQQFALKLRALTAMGRMSAAVLLGLPILIGVALSLLDHAYLAPLVDTASGRMALLGGIGLVAVGSIWLHRIVSGVE